MQPLVWRFVERRLRRRLPADAAAAVCGDLLEDYARERRVRGRLGAEVWICREAASVARAWSPPPSRARWGAGLLFDVRQAVAGLRRRPLMVLTAVVPAGLAIAASAVLFAITDGLLYRPLRNVPAADRLVDLRPVLIRDGAEEERLEPLLVRVRESPLFDALAWVHGAVAYGNLGGQPRTLRELAEAGTTVSAVSPSFFRAVGVQAARGRLLDRGLDEAPGPPAVVIGDRLWRTRLGGDLGVAGANVDLGGTRVRVVGVLPAGFDFPGGTDVWELADPRTEERSFPTLVRLESGATVQQARAAFPGLVFTPLSQAIRPDGSGAVAFLLAATLLLLLVSWLQVGALFVTRLASGGGEVSLRVALGASRLRVLRSFLIEAGLISGAAVAIAALVIPLAGAAMTTLLPPEIASGRRFDIDVRTLLFVGAAAVAGALLMSAITVDIVRRSHPATALRAGTSAARAPAAGRVRAAILLTQVGLTTVLLYMTGLAVHSFVRITAVDDGIDAQGLLAWEIPLTVESRAARQVRLDDVMSQLNAVPGVRATAASAWRPLRAPRFETPVVLSDLAGRPTVTSRYNFVTEEFFQTLGMTIVEGASPDRLGDEEAGRTAVINAALAERIRVHGPIVGREIELPAFEFRGRVVGVVANHLEQTSEEPPHPVVFLRHPTEGQRWWLLQVFVRTADPAGAATGSARIVRDVWGAGATTTVTFMTAEVSRAQSHWRARVLLLSLVAGLCVPLSLVGLAGALGRDVAERKYEVAVRLALGAEPSRIRGAVVRRAVSLVGLGLAIGLGGGWAVGRLMDSYLFGVRAADAATMAGVAGVLLVCAWLAALGPAWRASRVDPALTLKEM